MGDDKEEGDSVILFFVNGFLVILSLFICSVITTTSSACRSFQW